MSLCLIVAFILAAVLTINDKTGQLIDIAVPEEELLVPVCIPKAINGSSWFEHTKPTIVASL